MRRRGRLHKEAFILSQYRILKFIVDGQRIKKDKNCDFTNIVSGSKGYLYAKFSFKNGWENCNIAASFWKLGEEYPVLLDSKMKCKIPDDALDWNNFKVSCMGMNGNYRITTNKIMVEQEQ